jgi:Tol biopolymer transport system component
MDPDGDNVVRRTLEGEVESQPQWSPNGFALVFVTAVQNNDEVCTGGTSGGAINISDNAARDYRPAWRP